MCHFVSYRGDQKVMSKNWTITSLMEVIHLTEQQIEVHFILLCMTEMLWNQVQGLMCGLVKIYSVELKIVDNSVVSSSVWLYVSESRGAESTGMGRILFRVTPFLRQDHE